MTEKFIFKWPMHQNDAQNNNSSLPTENIYITGDFDNWTKSTPLKPNYKEQIYETVLPIEKFDDQGKFVFKFYFKDTDTWKCSPLYPVAADSNGNQNNYITGSHMIEQAEELELVKRKNHQYSEAEELNEEIVSELEVDPPLLDNTINQISNYENDILNENVNESGEYPMEVRGEENNDDIGKVADVTVFPTENETIEDAIAEKKEHIPVLIHSTDQENKSIVNEPIETFLNHDEEKGEGDDNGIEEKQSEDHKGEQAVVSGSVTSNDIDDIDDIPTENRRKFKVRRKVKRNKRTGEKIILSQEIFELDQADNVIATYKSMEEAENNTVFNESDKPRERLYEIQNVNDADTVGHSSDIVSSQNDLRENIAEKKEVEEKSSIVKDDDDGDGGEGKGEKAENSSVSNNENSTKMEDNVVANDTEVTKEIPDLVDKNVSTSIAVKPSTEDQTDDITVVQPVEEPLVNQETMQNRTTESQEIESTSNKDIASNEEKSLVDESNATENKVSDADAKKNVDVEVPLEQEVTQNSKKSAEISPTKKTPTSKTESTGPSSKTTANISNEPKKSGIFSKLRRKFF